jgi:hypothetical protein
MILLVPLPMPLAAVVVLGGLIVVGVPLWLLCGWLADKYDAWRTDNWKGWR